MTARKAPLDKQRLIHLRDLFHEMILRDLRLRYKRSLLGIAWTLLNPLAQLLVFNLVFGVLLRIEIPNYLPFLFTGIIAWTWFSASLFQATSSIVDNRELIRRPGFPVFVLPAAVVGSHLVHFLMTLPILLAFAVIGGVQLSSALLLLPLVIVAQFLMTLSLASLAASLHVRFRDIQYLLGIALMLGFYLTPILYDTSALPSRYQALFQLNPMAHLIDAYRAIFMRGELPALGSLALITALSGGLLWLGYKRITHSSHRFVEEL